MEHWEKELLQEYGWSVVCESPFEIESSQGSNFGCA